MAHLRIVRRAPLTDFANTVTLYQQRLYRLWLISPWITTEGSKREALYRVLAATVPRRPRLTIITREPTNDCHRQALVSVDKVPNSEILTHPLLHAKLYLAECEGIRIAMFGSPNFTIPGDRENVELALEIRSGRNYDEAGRLITELVKFAQCLMVQEDVQLFEH